jgi:hypothetical protein
MNIKTKLFDRCEIVLHNNKTYANPFMDVDIDAVFTHEDGTVISLPGFWNGDDEWKVRFSPNKLGVWTYTVTCTDAENASLTDTGVIETEAIEPKTELEKHGYVKLTEGMRYLTYADGTPYFYLADTHWQMADYERLNECNYPGCSCGNQFKHLVDDRVKKGFTAYQTYFDSAESDGGGNKRRHNWWTEKYTLINPKAFNDTMDVMMEYLASVGLTTSIGFGVHTNSIVAFGSEVPVLRFTRYVVARYACYPVMWFTGQEITDEHYNTLNIWRKAADLVSKLDGYHRPNGAHMYPMTSDDHRARILDGDEWHKMWFLQAGHGGFDALKTRHFYKSYYDNEKVKPYFETENQYEDIYCGGFCGHDSSRLGAWQAILSGAAGFTYGVTGVWAMGWDQKKEPGWLIYSPEPWYIGMDKPGSTQMTYMKKFFDYVKWYELTPSFGHEFGSFENRRRVAIASKGKDIIIYYLYSPDEETGVLLGLKPDTRYQARWYDTATGKFIDLPDIITSNGEYDIPKKPSLRDWVLLLNTEDLGAYETEDYKPMPAPVSVDSITLGEEIKIASVKALTEDSEFPAKNLIDGNPDTHWEPYAPSTCQEFVFDLSKEEEISYIEFESHSEKMLFVRFQLFGSNDGVNYELFAERPSMIVGVGGQYPKFIDFANGKYRYLKLFINSTAQHDPKRQLTKVAFYKKA